jgi:muconolactone delta-isomerase
MKNSDAARFDHTEDYFGFFASDQGLFYVYILYRPNDQPFYVGKGVHDRIYFHEKEARRGHECHKCRVIRKIWRKGGQVKKQIVFRTGDEDQAYRVEAQLIAKYRDQIVNVCDKHPMWNGEAVKPIARRKRMTQEQRRKILGYQYGKLKDRIKDLERAQRYRRDRQIEVELNRLNEMADWILSPPKQSSFLEE